MKSLSTFLSIAILGISIMGSAQAQFVKLDPGKADQEQLAFAIRIATSYFETLKSGKSFDFSKYASKEFSDQMTPELQRQAYEQLKSSFGEFKSLEYAETWTLEDPNTMFVIRMKGTFEGSQEPLEIRVVVNNSNKVMGLWLKPWVEDLNQG